MNSPTSEEADENQVFLNPSLHRKDFLTSYSWVLKSKLGRLLAASLSLNVVLLCVGIPLLVGTLTKSRNVSSCSSSTPFHQEASGMNHELKQVSSYSPIFDQVDLDQHYQTFNGRIHDNTSIFRQPPSAEVDAAWDRLAAEGLEIVTVDEEAVVLSGKTPGLSVKAPASWGRGAGAYVAQIDVFHQIHCLNELRKEMHFDYYYGHDARLNATRPATRPADHAEHKRHCLHMLLQNLVCHADVGVVTHNWVHYNVPDQPGRPPAEPFADFNVIKKCRNFDALLDWAQENAVKDLPKRWAELKMPEGAEFVEGDGYW